MVKLLNQPITKMLPDFLLVVGLLSENGGKPANQNVATPPWSCFTKHFRKDPQNSHVCCPDNAYVTEKTQPQNIAKNKVQDSSI